MLVKRRFLPVIGRQNETLNSLFLSRSSSTHSDPIEKHRNLEELVQVFDETLDRCNRSKKKEDKI